VIKIRIKRGELNEQAFSRVDIEFEFDLGIS